jgi:hypothetical protein
MCALVGQGFIRAALTAWSLNYVYKEFIKRLDAPPPEIWEIRVTAPTPQGRLFGRFAEPGTFIITNMHTRSHLGRRGSANWKRAMSDCEGHWLRLFPGQSPFSGSRFGEYVTGSCDDHDL